MLLLYLLTYITGFYSSVFYYDYTTVQSDIGSILNKIDNDNNKSKYELDKLMVEIDYKLDLILNKESRYNMRRASP